MSYLRAYYNDKPLLGSDSVINITGLGVLAKQRALVSLKQRIDSLANSIKPYLKEGTVTYKEE